MHRCPHPSPIPDGSQVGPATHPILFYLGQNQCLLYVSKIQWQNFILHGDSNRSLEWNKLLFGKVEFFSWDLKVLEKCNFCHKHWWTPTLALFFVKIYFQMHFVKFILYCYMIWIIWYFAIATDDRTICSYNIIVIWYVVKGTELTYRYVKLDFLSIPISRK